MSILGWGRRYFRGTSITPKVTTQTPNKIAILEVTHQRNLVELMKGTIRREKLTIRTSK